jgi:hypothetical protein
MRSKLEDDEDEEEEDEEEEEPREGVETMVAVTLSEEFTP